MKKKVGVVTLTGGSNYGNKLQHYAVLHTLHQLGYEAVTVRDMTTRGFADPLHEAAFSEKLTPHYAASVLQARLQYQYHRKNESDGILRCILRERKRKEEFAASEKERQRRFDAFTEKYLPYGDLTVSADQLPDEAVVRTYHAFVCGSDQVWNPNYRETSPIRFLSFAPPEKRIALSPSFGVSAIPEVRREAYRKGLQEMASLSVRETSGQRIIRELTGREAPVLIDPTLMLTTDLWDEIAERPERFSEEPFLLTYFLGNKSKQYESVIQTIAQKHGWRIINLFEISETESYRYDPAEFLWLFQHAAFICTDSFHGTVFSILYHKDFFSFSRDESGFSKDSRVLTLLQKLDLPDCIYTGKPYRRPDYEKAEVRLEEERKQFLSYLQNALERTQEEEKTAEYPHVQAWNEADPFHCSGCSACASVCSVSAITMKKNAEGFWEPMVEETLCTNCRKCIKVCRMAERIPQNTPSAFAIRNQDEAIRMHSSSGGAFYSLAKYVIQNNGLVFGACFDADWNLIHTSADNLTGVRAFMGSKYLQSDMRACYSEVKAALKSKRQVLFSGTPCQIGGLYACLGKEDENLITVDIICHGTPSQMALDAYLNDHGGKASLQSCSFRNKDRGWGNFSMKLVSDHGTYRRDLNHDSYLVAFLRNCNLRYSCYRCRFKTATRRADLTLADFWGVSRVLGGLDDDRGVSLVLVQSEKGRRMLSLLKDELFMQEVPMDKALQNNSAALHSTLMPENRKQFYQDIAKDGFEHTVLSCYPMTMERRIGYVKENLYKIKQKTAGGKS